jgi:hypothetical protein
LQSIDYHRGIGERWRLRAYGAGALNLLLGGSSAGLAAAGVRPGPRAGLEVALLALAIATVFNTAFARVLIRTDANRRFLRSMWLVLALVAAQQAYSAWRGVALDDAIRASLLVLLAATSVLGIALIRRALALSVTTAVALGASLALPGRPLIVGAVLFFLNAFTFGFLLSGEQSAAPPDDAPSTRGG